MIDGKWKSGIDIPFSVGQRRNIRLKMEIWKRLFVRCADSNKITLLKTKQRAILTTKALISRPSWPCPLEWVGVP